MVKRFWRTDDTGVPAKFVLASDYAALEARCRELEMECHREHNKNVGYLDRIAELETSLEKYQACRVHDLDEKAWLSKRCRELEANHAALLKELRNCVWTDKHGHQRTDIGYIKELIGYESETACEHDLQKPTCTVAVFQHETQQYAQCHVCKETWTNPPYGVIATVNRGVKP